MLLIFAILVNMTLYPTSKLLIWRKLCNRLSSYR